MLEHPRAIFRAESHAADLVSLLQERTQAAPTQRAFTYLTDGEQQREHITFGELDRQARVIAAHLQARGLAGARALLLYPSGLEFVAAFFGCLYAGVTAVPAYPPRRNRNLLRIRSIVDDATPGVALTTHSVYDRVEPMIQEEPHLRTLPWQCTTELEASLADAWAAPQIDPSTLAFLQYTSGSTGAPKGVMLSHGNLVHNTRLISDAFQPSRAGAGVTWLPLYHDMGLIGGVIQPIYFGRHNTLISPAHFLQKPVRWLRALSDTGALISGGPNFAYELCVERVSDEEKKSLDLSQWEVAFNGAEPVRGETMRRFYEAFAPCGFRPEAFFPCYGLAEATLMVAGGDKWTPPETRLLDAEALKTGRAVPASGEQAIEVVSSGGAWAEQEVAIVDPEDLRPCEDQRVGEVWVRGPSVAQGYWQREQLTREVFQAQTADGRGPFLRTGDLGFMADGQLYITGRLKDLIIIRGANHYPQDIELTVEQSHATLPKSAGAAVAVGGAGEERLVVIQEMGRQRDLPFEEIFDMIRHHVSVVHDVAPSAIVLIKPNSIPKTSSGKIQRHACRDAYQDRTLSVVAEWSLDSGLMVHRKRGAERIARRAAAAAEAEANGVAVPAPAPRRPPEPAPTASTIERVMHIVRGVAKERAADATLDTEIAAMGLDSLERMEIVAALEDDFGGRFSEDAILGMETCRDVVRAVERELLHVAPLGGEREVTEADYVFVQSPEYKKLRASFDLAEAAGAVNPYFTQHEGLTNDRTTIGGREYINWCSYNYLGMSGDPAVEAAAKAAIDRYGTSVSASRLVSGEKPLHRDLERAIAEFLGAEDAITFVGGHATNESVIGHMFGPGDLILHDALAHNSIVQGCRLSGAHRRGFAHNEPGACEDLLRRYRNEYRRVLIVVEGVYSMDGDITPLPEFVRLKREHKAYLMVDEAHSLGTVGETGRGVGELFGVPAADVDLWMGTMSKSLGSCGGFIAASRPIVEYLKYTAPGFVYSVGVAPAGAAAALESLRLIEAEPERVARLSENSRRLLTLAKKEGLNTGMSEGTPVIPVIVGNSLHALELSQRLFEQGVNVQPIMYPAVEESAARLRFFVTSTHTEEQTRRTVKALADAWRALHHRSGEASRVELIRPA